MHYTNRVVAPSSSMRVIYTSPCGVLPRRAAGNNSRHPCSLLSSCRTDLQAKQLHDLHPPVHSSVALRLRPCHVLHIRCRAGDVRRKRPRSAHPSEPDEPPSSTGEQVSQRAPISQKHAAVVPQAVCCRCQPM